MKVEWVSCPCVPVEELEQNVRICAARDLPRPEVRDYRPPLAVVGGGPSLPSHLDELRAWQGDIWACGSPYPWLRDHGIEAVFFNIDPLEETIELARGAKHAILSSTNHPGVFDVVERAEVFDLVTRADWMNHNVTTATAAPALAFEIGHREITFFACESSFLEGSTHAYKHEDFECFLWVECGGEMFVTKPQLLMQAEFLSECMRRWPRHIRERSGGLLRALIATPDYDVVGVNEAGRSLLTLYASVKVECEHGQMMARTDELPALLEQGYSICAA